MNGIRLTNTGMLTAEEIRYHIDTLNNEGSKLFDTISKVKSLIEEIPYDVYAGGGVSVFAESIEELSINMTNKKHILEDIQIEMENFISKAESDTANIVAAAQSNLAEEEIGGISSLGSGISNENTVTFETNNDLSNNLSNDTVFNQNQEVEYTYVDNTVVSNIVNKK